MLAVPVGCALWRLWSLENILGISNLIFHFSQYFSPTDLPRPGYPPPLTTTASLFHPPLQKVAWGL